MTVAVLQCDAGIYAEQAGRDYVGTKGGGQFRIFGGCSANSGRSPAVSAQSPGERQGAVLRLGGLRFRLWLRRVLRSGR